MGLFDAFKGLFETVPESVASRARADRATRTPTNVRRIENWTMQESFNRGGGTVVAGTLRGEPIITSRIRYKYQDLHKAPTVTTESGSLYALGKRSRQAARFPSYGYAILDATSPVGGTIPEGKVCADEAELRSTLQAAAVYLRDEDPVGYPRVRGSGGVPAGVSEYKVLVERLADGQTRWLTVDQDDGNRRDWIRQFSKRRAA